MSAARMPKVGDVVEALMDGGRWALAKVTAAWIIDAFGPAGFKATTLDGESVGSRFEAQHGGSWRWPADPLTTTVRGEGAPAVKLPYTPPTLTEIDVEAMRVASEVQRLCGLIRTKAEQLILAGRVGAPELLYVRKVLTDLAMTLYLNEPGIEADEGRAYQAVMSAAEVRR